MTGRNNFERVKKEGEVGQSESFALAVFERKEVGPSRIGFIISNKISKRAVVRNKAKRLLRSILISKLADLKQNCDLVFLAKGKIVGKGAKDLGSEIKNVLEKRHLLTR